jgi:hypothetical protein
MIGTLNTSAFIPRPVVFVLEINRKAILAFEAISAQEAKVFIEARWLKQDLRRLRSNGTRLWDGKAKLKVGFAVGAQVSHVKALLRNASTGTELTIAYLVPLDGA